jgi:hypothetical protein
MGPNLTERYDALIFKEEDRCTASVHLASKIKGVSVVNEKGERIFIEMRLIYRLVHYYNEVIFPDVEYAAYLKQNHKLN